MVKWEIEDLMTVVLGRQIADGEVIHCGAFTPMVLASGMWAMARHAPNAVILPISLTGVRTFKPFPISYSLLEGMTLEAGVQYPMVDIFTHVEGPDGCGYEPVNPLQIDQWGNVNMSVIGPFDAPKFRGPGAAGMDVLPLMLNHKLVLYAPRHTPRIFVESVDFVTGVGNNLDRRRDTGAKHGGMRLIVTDLCVMDFNDSGRARVTSLHPKVTWEQVRKATGFDLDIATDTPEDLPVTPEPTEEDMKTLEFIDPLKVRTFEFMSATERRERLPSLLLEEWEHFSALAGQG